MLRVTLASLRHHRARYATTVVAILLGVVFVSGTLVFTNTIETTSEAKLMGSASQFDAIVTPSAPENPDDIEETASLPEETPERIQELPEVATAVGVVSDRATLLDSDGRPLGYFPAAAVSVAEDSRFQVSEGRLPEADHEAVLATGTAEQTRYAVGDTITVLDQEDQRHELTVTGLVDFGAEEEYTFAGAVGYTEATARMLTGADGYQEIDVVAAPDRTATEVTTAITAVVGSEAVVRTGEQFGADLAEAAGADIAVLRMGLLLFGVVAVFVAGIVIYNTFAILIAQRQRDLALLRCVGAGRGQIFRGVLTESALVGLVAAALGTAAGVGGGYAAVWLAGDLFEVSTGEVRLAVGPAAIVTGLVLGTGMTVVSAFLPALRATRVPPLTALRTSATAARLDDRVSWPRLVVGAGFFAGATALVALSQAMEPSEVAMTVVVAAGISAFFGVAVLGPVIVRGAVRVAGLVVRRMGAAGMLAVDNSRRSPKRAATAMIALAVGVTLMTGFSVVSSSMDATLTQELDQEYPVDYQITPQIDFDSPVDGEDTEVVPHEVAAALADDPAIGQVFTERSTFVAADIGETPVSAYPGTELDAGLPVSVVSGDLADLASGGVVLSEDYASGLLVGDTITLATDTGTLPLEIAAVVTDDSQLWGAIVDPADYAAAFPDDDADRSVLVRAAPDAAPADVRDAVYAAVDDYPTLHVFSAAETRNELDEILQTTFYVIAAMLGLAVLIAVFGIANTLALSVLERTRESALLRALGLERRQLRRMLAVEAVLLSLIGAGVGVVSGLVLGWAAGGSVWENLVFAVPVEQVALFLTLAVLAGLLASVLPARRAAQASITGALGSE